LAFALALLASFRDRDWRSKQRSSDSVVAGEHVVKAGLGLQSFEFLERALVGAFESGVVAREALRQRVAHIGLGLEDADAAEIPVSGHEFVKQSLLDGALGLNILLIVREQLFELFALLGIDDGLLRGEAVFAGVLRAARFTFFSARAGAELRIGAIGFDFEFR
jgi:hypothetical protein